MWFTLTQLDVLAVFSLQALTSARIVVLAAMCAKLSPLNGVADEWDSSERVRLVMWARHRLFVPAEFQDEPTATILCGDANYEALKPLVRRLRQGGQLGMHSVGDILREILG